MEGNYRLEIIRLMEVIAKHEVQCKIICFI